MPERLGRRTHSGGLDALRRSGVVTETLFLYECATRPVPKLRIAADDLGLTVQAVSHLSRRLVRRSWVERRNGLYGLTVAGRAALQERLSALAEEIDRRLQQLQIVRTTQAVAGGTIRAGEPVGLTLENGTLTARPGARSPSRGRARGAAHSGELLEVAELDGIVPISPGAITVYVVPRGEGASEWARRAAARAIRRGSAGLVVAQGLEAQHVAGRAGAAPVVRFGAPAACLEASRLGVDSLAFVTEEELPRFLAPFAGPSPPPITVSRLA